MIREYYSVTRFTNEFLSISEARLAMAALSTGSVTLHTTILDTSLSRTLVDCFKSFDCKHMTELKNEFDKKELLHEHFVDEIKGAS